MTSTRDSAELVNNLKDSAFDFNIYSSVASAKADTKLKVGDTVQTTGYYTENDGGGATYIVVAGGTGTDDGGSYHDIVNGLQLELIHESVVLAKWFGVRGDCGLLMSSGDTPTGTDDTARVKAVCTYVQNKSVFNYARGASNEYILKFDATMRVRLTGDNPLGTTLPRITASSTPTEKLVRCNWYVDGGGCLFYWNPINQTDTFIESHESLVRQHYKGFTVVGSDWSIGDKKGILYSNIANDGQNGTTWHKFEDVRTDMAGTGYVAASDTGYYRVFQYEGTNLGDKLTTEFCSFRYFVEGLYSNNLEAVSQRIMTTGFYSYMADAVLFFIQRHGSSFTVEDCDLLLKGENTTLLKLKIDPSFATGIAGASAIFNFNNNRTETEAGNKVTLIDADFGIVNYNDSITTAGGLPDPDSILYYAHGNAILNLKSCVIYGRVASGDYTDSGFLVKRNYSIDMNECHFISDPSDSIGVYDGTTFTPYYQLQEVSLDTRAILVRNSNNRTSNWQGGIGDDTPRIYDFLYNAYTPFSYHDDKNRATLFQIKGSPGFQFPQIIAGNNLGVLPASCVIENIKVNCHNLFASADEVTIHVGSASHTFNITAADGYRNGSEIMPDDVLVIPSNNEAERTLSISAMKGGLPVGTALKLTVEITYRPIYGDVDNTSSNVNAASFKLAKVRSTPT